MTGWIGRTPFDRMLDEIVSAESVRELDHLLDEARRALAGDSRIGEVERIGAAMRRLVRQRGTSGASPNA